MTKLDEQLEEILSGITTIDEIAEVERAISEVKGKILAEPGQGFWEEKTPCWEMLVSRIQAPGPALLADRGDLLQAS